MAALRLTRICLLCPLLLLVALAQVPQPTPSPEKSLQKHPFLYCGEWQAQKLTEQTMYIVRDGAVAWTYTNPLRGEFSDCTRLSDGNILVARQFGASEISQDKQTVWNYDAPAGTEIHSAYPLGSDRVLLLQNGSPAKLLVLRKRDNHIETEIILHTASASVHGQFRRARPTPDGTFLVAHMDMGKVVEYDATGKSLWSVDAPSAWAAVRLKNGNTLISGNEQEYVREVDRAGKTVWEINRDDLPGIHLNTVQEVTRLQNGNTLINNWSANLPVSKWPSTPQVLEVTPAKKVVWIVQDWSILGPASTTQLLDEPGIAERGDLQR